MRVMYPLICAVAAAVAVMRLAPPADSMHGLTGLRAPALSHEISAKKKRKRTVSPCRGDHPPSYCASH
jgi:hypothetical protein